MKGSMSKLIRLVLDNSDRAIVEDVRAVPTLREVCLARALSALVKDLNPADPRSELLDRMCEEGSLV